MAALRHGVVSLLLATITAGLTCQKDVAAERAFDVKEALKQFKDAVNDRIRKLEKLRKACAGVERANLTKEI